MDMRGSTAIVTGGAGGLGSQVCRDLVAAGANVTAGYLTSQGEAQALVTELNTGGATRAIAVRADITIQAEIDALLQQTLDAFGRVDILVNSSGWNRRIPFSDLDSLDEALWNQIIQTNLTGPFLIMRSVAPIMKKQGAGRIVNVTSIAGLSPRGSSIAYSTAKAGLTQLTRCMAIALAPEILVNAVAPGMLEGTKMGNNLGPQAAPNYRQNSLLHRPPWIADVSAAIMAMLANDSITGQTLAVDSGMVFH